MGKLQLKVCVTLPVEIITRKISKNRTDSIFYAGKTIAKIRTKNFEYVLTTAGDWRFTNANRSVRYYQYSSEVKKLTDKDVENLGDLDLVSNWGWFGINVWKYDSGKWSCLDYPTDVYSRYDEAMKAFIEYSQEHIKGQLKA